MRKPRPFSEKAFKIGIPRAFFYYIYPGLWETFFREIGIEPVVSGPSSRKTLELAAFITEAEHCLPNKLFDGHLAEIVDKVDMVFVPRLLSSLKGHISCPKLSTLPDAALAEVARERDVLCVDINENVRPLSKTLLELGRKLSIGKRTVRSAIENAMRAMKDREAELDQRNKAKKKGKRFLIVGHPYTMHDAFFSESILRKLESLNVNIELMSFANNDVPESFIRWCTSNKMYHKLTTISKGEYAGVIQISSFNCGCDSMMIEIFRNILKEKSIPYMVIILDEHTAQAGTDTRLEAFVDSLEWQDDSSSVS
jgi:predicted nucleotide-binding protein (sugar kinase/HSP70/actin superfamily)